jgi:hypothetical protein
MDEATYAPVMERAGFTDTECHAFYVALDKPGADLTGAEQDLFVRYEIARDGA